MNKADMHSALAETGRTLLRHFVPEDLEELHEIFSDSMVMEHIEEPFDRKRTRDFLEDVCIARRRALAVVHKAGGKLIGYALCSDRLEKDVYEIGWIFNRAYWGQGLAFESIQAVMAHCFLSKKAHKVWAEAMDGTQSVPLMRKLGMQQEGVQRQQTRDVQGAWRDLHYYGLLRRDYLNQQADL
ncbi:MAG: GNAT family N-acetyltransferase [Clostridiales bacterium]|nr:GNAT family N-acetyltransferase [Clostridiales bacterium]